MRGHRGHVYERHPWRKGWPRFLVIFSLVVHVGTQELQSHLLGGFEHLLFGLLSTTDPQMLWAVLAHACTLIGLSVGSVDRANVLPTHRLLFQQRDVEKNRRRIIMYYARPPDHQQPSRRGARIPARPDTATSVPTGFPTHLLTPVIRTPHPPDRPQFPMASNHPARCRGARPEAGQPPDPRPAPGDACLPYNVSLG